MDYILKLTSLNLVTIVLLVILGVSIIQGAVRGAAGSARHLVQRLIEGVFTIVALIGAWITAAKLSPYIHHWLTEQGISIPTEKLTAWQQVYYMLVTSLRDFPLFRIGICFILAYMLYSMVLNLVQALIRASALSYAEDHTPTKRSSLSWLSCSAGAGLGIVSGSGRVLLFIAGLFIFNSLFPSSSFSSYINQSELYQIGASKVIQPVGGEWIDKQLPVITKSVTDEYQKVLRRKYDIVDQHIPDHIEDAAIEITRGLETDKDKAKALYEWVGTRVQYDWEKVRLLEEEQVWKEQTPIQTFDSRQGVCIDYSRLYAQMARAVGLEVEVITGLGYNGKGGYGPHAWNEVYLSEYQDWVPLDTTWVSSGGNWFNPEDFESTHIKDV